MMKNIQKSIRKESSKDLPDMETEPMEYDGHSNEEADMETEDGQQECKDAVDSIMAEMDDEKAKKAAAGGQKKTSEEELRKKNELEKLSVASLLAEMERLEKQVHELGQREAREIIRSKHLNILGTLRRRATK